MCPGTTKAAQVSNGCHDVRSRSTAEVNVNIPSDALLNMEQGDPTMCEPYWEQMGDEGALTIPGGKSLSYFSAKDFCWFTEPQLIEAIRRLHSVVGNAVTKDKFIVVGTGSTHLLHAALYALTTPYAHRGEPVNVISAVPYYSGYPEIADLMRSSLYKWGGDATVYHKDGPYIELICSPNNPDGSMKGPVVADKDSRTPMLVHDFAYLWPQFTPISAPADHDLMLFTLSKSTGHAGSRIGWALVKDKSVAERMAHFIITTTIGASKEAQLRATKIMGALADQSGQKNDFFKHSHLILKDRWRRLRDVTDQNGIFILKDYQPSYCSYLQDTVKSNPAFAWLSSDYISDAAEFFRRLNILVRGGDAFGTEREYVRVSMVGRDDDFNQFLQKLAVIKKTDLIALADHA